MEIVKLNDRPDLFDEAVDFFWLEWGNPENFRFYYDCMLNSCSTESDLPRFYIALFENKIVGSYALLRNDLISRQDLT
ncbi:GNAT family N-acetyltransferase, partial [Neobacillus sp. SM06]